MQIGAKMIELPWNKKNSIRFTIKEHLWFLKRIKEIEKKLDYKIADIGRCELFWEKNYGVKNGILGSFNWLNPKTIKVSILGKEQPEMIISTIIHELHHKWQYQKYKYIYPILAIPVLRQITLEKTALIIEKQADEIIGLEGLNDE